MAKTQPTITQQADLLSHKLEAFFIGSLPALPDSVKEFIVKVGPYITLITMVMLLPVIAFGLGLGALFTPFSFLGGMSSGFGFILALIVAFGSLILNFMALPGLFKRARRSWTLVYYATLLTLFEDLMKLHLGSFLFSAFLSFYFLFQIKSKYTK